MTMPAPEDFPAARRNQFASSPIVSASVLPLSFFSLLVSVNKLSLDVLVSHQFLDVVKIVCDTSTRKVIITAKGRLSGVKSTALARYAMAFGFSIL